MTQFEFLGTIPLTGI